LCRKVPDRKERAAESLCCEPERARTSCVKLNALKTTRWQRESYWHHTRSDAHAQSNGTVSRSLITFGAAASISPAPRRKSIRGRTPLAERWSGEKEMTVCYDGRPLKVSYAIERVAPALSEVVQTKEWLPYISRRLVTLTSDSHSSSASRSASVQGLYPRLPHL
jgi:hypothetical protein